MFNDSASRLVFTYSAVPARRLSFAHPSLNLRSRFAQGSVRVWGKNSKKNFGKLSEFAKVCGA